MCTAYRTHTDLVHVDAAHYALGTAKHASRHGGGTLILVHHDLMASRIAHQHGKPHRLPLPRMHTTGMAPTLRAFLVGRDFAVFAAPPAARFFFAA